MDAFQVVSRGIEAGRDKALVEQQFAQLFKLAPGKASALLAKSFVVLRSNLDQQTASTYCDKLKSIGVDAASMKMPASAATNPVASPVREKKTFASLALEPIAAIDNPKEVPGQVSDAQTVGPKLNPASGRATYRSNFEPRPEEDDVNESLSFPERFVDVLRMLVPGPKLLILLIVLGIGAYWHKTGRLPLVAPTGAYTKSGEPEVVFFAFANCGDICRNVSQELTRRGVKFRQPTLFQKTNLTEEDTKTDDFKLFEKNNRHPLIIGERSTSEVSKGTLVSMLALTFGKKYLLPDEVQYMQNHFYPDGRPRVYIYGATWCGFCKSLRESLKRENVEFIEFDLDITPEGKTISEVMDIPGYPVTYVGYRRLPGNADVAMVKQALQNY